MDLKHLTIPKTFNVTVTIHECRDLILAKSTDTASPYARIKVRDKVQETQVFKEQQNPFFNQSFEFVLKIPLMELKTTKILISLYHKTSFYLSDELIGDHSIDAYKVYDQSTHMFNKIWGNLEREGEISGKKRPSVNYSVLVISAGDQIKAQIGDNQESESGQEKENQENQKQKLAANIIGKPQVEVKGYLLQIGIFKGEFTDIPGISEINSKVKLIISQNEQIETISINNTKNPTWRILHSIPMKTPFYIDYLIFEVIQDDSNALLGRILLDFKVLSKEGVIEPKWYCFYGPERDNKSFFTKLKYEYEFGKEIEPYYYAGRILIEAKLLADESATKMLNAQASEISFPLEKKYTCWIDIYELSSEKLSSSDNVYVEVQVGPTLKVSSKEAIYNDKLRKFYWTNKRFETFQVPLPTDLSICPDIFIRIYKKGSLFDPEAKEYIAYKRFSMQEIVKKKNNIKVTWEKLRMINTLIKGDSDENFLGLLLCSLNLFNEEESLKRPVVIESNSFKKYKLIAFICMGTNLNSIGSRLPNPLVEISFNGKTKRTEKDENTINPVWNTSIKITTTLNENLELSDNIKLSLIDTGGIVESTLGKTEISITSIQKYNNKDYIDNELFKIAKWYNLYEGIELLETKILAIFFIVKLVSQTKEHIILKEYQLLPKEDRFRLYMFSIGCRKLDLSTDLTDGYVIIRYYKDDLETKADKSEFFKSTSSINQIRNLNNLDLIGEEYSVISLATSKEFIKNLQILVYTKSDALEYSATIDLSQIINKSENEVRTNAVNFQKDDAIRKLMKKPEKTILNTDEIIPLYYENSEQIGAQKKYIEMYRRTMESFPTDVEEINNEIGEETYFDNYYIEIDKRGKAKEDDDSDGKINRPEVDYPYETDLPDNQLDFITSPLQKAGEKKECGLIRYVMKIVRENDPILCEDVDKKFKETVDFIQETRKKNCIFICRIYLLNVSNLKLSDSSVEDAFVWIKRYHDDREYKDSKRPFKVNTGEVNSTYAIEVVWPDTFFVNIEFYESINSFGIIRENLIGSTEIDLEKRYFHPVYQQKMKNHKKFKQIPIESRTLYGNDGEMAKGAVRMWLEIVPKKKNDAFPITPLVAQNMEKYEMRIVIWNTREVPLVDGKVNIQVKVQMFDGKEEVDQYTDTHNNSKDGVGEFNWRIVIPFWYPSNKTNLNLSIYNDNLIAKDEILGFANIDMRKYYNILHKTKSVLEVPREWIPLEPSPQVQAQYDIGGEIELEIKILTWQEAENNKVGKGQNEPNKDPVLERPKNGRNFLDNLSFIGDLIDSVANFAGGFLGMIKFLGVIGTIVGIAYFIMQMVK